MGGIDGAATIDYGIGKPEQVKYDSMAKLIDDLYGKGWTLLQTSISEVQASFVALLVFEKK